MLLIITNGIVSAILFFLAIFPPLYINRSFSPEEDASSLCINELCSDSTMSNSVKQKLYLLVIIPLCVTLNCIFLYFSYYRSIRFIQFRVELNIISLYEYRGEVQNMHGTLDGIPPRIHGQAKLGRKSFGNAVLPPMQHRKPSTIPNGGTELNAYNTANSANAASSFDWRARAEFIRYTRPKNVKKDAYVIHVFFPEIRDLYIEVENIFFTPAMIAEKNFLTVRDKLVNSAGSLPTVNPKPSRSTVEPITKGHYNSKHIPVLLLGASVRKQLQQQQQKHHTREFPFSTHPMGTSTTVPVAMASDTDDFHSTVLRLTDMKGNVRPPFTESQPAIDSDEFEASEVSPTMLPKKRIH
ncbi:unnamed protein product [Phytomonas sp. EM1]|nr:unnamed protein product [Phytomonas sp. EM1]|eukprot:CCW62943.1 unnamed protein product [Phytomonas sp. isolate EM1]